MIERFLQSIDLAGVRLTTRQCSWICVTAFVVMAGATCLASDSSQRAAVTISISPTSVPENTSATLTWSSTNAASCVASGAWHGERSRNGSLTVIPETAGNLKYTLTCTGTGPAATASATLNSTLALSNTFSPNTKTISTSEGAPYGFCNFWVQEPSKCAQQSKFGYGPTRLMHLQICLSGEVTITLCSQQPPVTGPLSEEMLNDIDSHLAAYAGTGMRLVVRFTYNFGPIGPTAMDAPIDVISQNIDQLAPILLRHQDLIAAMEAGFIGTWAEWHNSTNGNDTAAAQQIVLDKELSYFTGTFPILVRYPGDLLQYTATTVPQPGLGLHDDFYASNDVDGGTWSPCYKNGGYCLPDFTSDQLEKYGAEVSKTTMFIGEFGNAPYPALQNCVDLADYSYRFHAQSITLHPLPPIAKELRDEGCALDFYNKVGTRIELQDATIVGSPTPNGKLNFTATLVNTGFGRVIRSRPVSLVFVVNDKVAAEIPIPIAAMDVTRLASSSAPVPRTFHLNVTLPATFPSAGSVLVALLIPDPAPSLTAQPAYALPLNSEAEDGRPVFDQETGYNVIAHFKVGDE